MSMQDRFLRAMGIDVWRLRQAVSDFECSVPVSCFQLVDQSSQAIGACFLEQRSESAKVAQLFSAIFSAVQLTAQPVENIPEGAGMLIIMGDKNKLSPLCANDDAIILPHPEEILTDASLKALVWEKLLLATQ